MKIESMLIALVFFLFKGFISKNMPQRAIDLFFEIEKPNEFIFTSFFNACAQLRTKNALAMGKKVFAQLPIEYQKHIYLLNAVLNMLIKCDDIENAELLFARLNRDVISYGSLMNFYNDNVEPEKTLELFERMKEEKIKPNEIIFQLLITACSKIGDLSLCEDILSQMPQTLFSNHMIQGGLIHMWVSE